VPGSTGVNMSSGGPRPPTGRQVGFDSPGNRYYELSARSKGDGSSDSESSSSAAKTETEVGLGPDMSPPRRKVTAVDPSAEGRMMTSPRRASISTSQLTCLSLNTKTLFLSAIRSSGGLTRMALSGLVMTRLRSVVSKRL
jgi:hypothetical protein